MHVVTGLTIVAATPTGRPVPAAQPMRYRSSGPQWSATSRLWRRMCSSADVAAGCGEIYRFGPCVRPGPGGQCGRRPGFPAAVGAVGIVPPRTRAACGDPQLRPGGADGGAAELGRLPPVRRCRASRRGPPAITAPHGSAVISADTACTRREPRMPRLAVSRPGPRPARRDRAARLRRRPHAVSSGPTPATSPARALCSAAASWSALAYPARSVTPVSAGRAGRVWHRREPGPLQARTSAERPDRNPPHPVTEEGTS
jgi:hypothetical protein